MARVSRLTLPDGSLEGMGILPSGGYASGKAFWARVNNERKGVPDDVLLRKAYDNVLRRLKKAELPRMPKVRLFKHGQYTLYVLRIGDRMITSNSWRGLTQKAAWGPWQSFNKSTLIRKRWHEAGTE